MQLKSITEEAADCRAAWADAPKAKIAHCCHHEVHVEPLTEPAENRIEYILREKPKREQALRLRLFRPWTVRLPKAMQKADADWQKADADRQRAYADWQKAYADRQKAYADMQKADADWQKAYADWQQTPAFIKEHTKLFPDCTWNGKSIFGKDE